MTKHYILKEYNCIFYYKDESQADFHREDGPAVRYYNGDKFWYVNGERHRVDGPAVEYNDGHKEWCLNGKWHRIDGPAIEYSNGDKFWYLNGVQCTEKEHKRLVKMINFL